jgi:hypothetical protein
MLPVLISFLFLPFLSNQPMINMALPSVQKLSYHEFSLNNRYENSFVNDVFKDNILLAVNYTAGQKIDPQNINWSNVEKPFKFSLTLKPGQTFSFHDDVLPQYQGKITRTTNAHFNSQEGFKSDGYLVGDGVCHFASLLYWVAKDAGLDTLAPTRHDFANIPEVPREYGTSIYSYPGKSQSNEAQNLYITNNKGKDVTFVFNFDGEKLGITAQEDL